MPWALDDPSDAAYRDALQALQEVSGNTDHDSAIDAEGWLQAAHGRVSGFARLAIGAARSAASSAAEIDLDLPGVDNSKQVAEVARHAGRTLATAAWTSNHLTEAIHRADEVSARLAAL